LFAEPPPNVLAQQPTEYQRRKAIRNRLEYQKRKGEWTEQRLEEAQDELSDVRDQVACLQHSYKLISVEAANSKAAAEKAECLLSIRTDMGCNTG
jgi:chromosome segregation ATPase